MYPKGLVPQADSLAVVNHVVEAIAAGFHADIDIVPMGYTDRQGRYYRLATDGLGLTVLTGSNHAELTSVGRFYAAASSARKRVLLRELVMSQNPFFRGLLAFIAGSTAGRTRDEITAFVENETGLSRVTAARRYSTIHAWLIELGLVDEVGGRLRATGVGPGFGRAEVASGKSILEGIPPHSRPTTAPRVPEVVSEPRFVQRLVDEAKLERANSVHEMLRVRVAANAGDSGYVTRPNGYIDVYAASQDREVIFEVKSATDKNFMKQVRGAVSQLHEYRYYQGLPAADLCIVIERAPPTGAEEVLDYLYDDRGIAVLHLDRRGRLIEPAGREGPMSEFIDA